MAHIFISYVRENSDTVAKLAAALRASGADVWLDRTDLSAGQSWEAAIREGIRTGAYFIACFSPEYSSKANSYMTQELDLAVDELGARSTRGWFIPVRLANCEIPDRPIGGGETIRSIQWVDLFPDWNRGLRQLKAACRSALRSTLLQSPWLGITFRQLNEPAIMLKDDDSIRVLLQPEPFQMRFPTAKPGDSVRIAASYDSAIFSQIDNDRPLEDIPYFASGTGMADTDFGEGNIWIQSEAHMHLDWGARLTPDPNGGGTVLVNAIYEVDENHEEPEIMPTNKDVALVVMIGPPKLKTAEYSNFERFTLSFS
ncbi:MAG TPA: toll/interleukin-1 receptor domain-containing protein [Pyrinomonadaceae bacterium]|nr:toll/interleukin-1 receptor domain-containing protein [Pyrinomonadaceae bacterium]